MQAFMQFNQEEANKASGSEYLQNGGAHIVTIISNKFVKAKSGSTGLELCGQTSSGEKVNYLTLYFEKSDGSTIAGGRNAIQAIMGLCNIPQISQAQIPNTTDWHVPELNGKTVGLFLQKKLYTKNDGNDGYSFEISLPFHPQNKATMRELSESKQPAMVDKMESNYKDIDERKQSTPQNSGGQFGNMDHPNAPGNSYFG